MDRKKIRFLYWIALAYYQKHARFFAASFVASIILLSALLLTARKTSFYSITTTLRWGIAGSYQIQTIPPAIVEKLTTSLLTRQKDGSYTSTVLDQWVPNAERTRFVLHLKKGLKYSDGSDFDAKSIWFRFPETSVRLLDSHTIEYSLSKPFPVFFDYLTRPLIQFAPFRYIGGSHVIRSVIHDPATSSLREIELTPLTQNETPIHVKFYKTESDLSTAFKFGEIDNFTTSSESAYTNFKMWPHTKTFRASRDDAVVALFFNNTHPLLSQRDLREAIYGGIPLDIIKKYGDLAVSPLRRSSPFYDTSIAHIPENAEVYKTIARRYLKEASREAVLTIHTSLDYLAIAHQIRDFIKSSGAEAEIEIGGVQKNASFDILIGLWKIPSEAKQYFVWHSAQDSNTNITRYSNKKTDKVLEDYRATDEAKLQQKLMIDFQKKIARDVPAAMLYYPFEYTIVREK
jgi:ABC-type transport system substrate-binding protein